MTTDREGTDVPDRRWPRWVYGSGDEPDYRFSLANERTLLAWLRTALALLAGGVAIDQVDLDTSAATQTLLATVLVVLGGSCAVASWWRWAGAERAIRRREPLPSTSLGLALTLGVLVVGVIVLVAL